MWLRPWELHFHMAGTASCLSPCQNYLSFKDQLSFAKVAAQVLGWDYWITLCSWLSLGGCPGWGGLDAQQPWGKAWLESNSWVMCLRRPVQWISAAKWARASEPGQAFWEQHEGTKEWSGKQKCAFPISPAIRCLVEPQICFNTRLLHFKYLVWLGEKPKCLNNCSIILLKYSSESACTSQSPTLHLQENLKCLSSRSADKTCIKWTGDSGAPKGFESPFHFRLDLGICWECWEKIACADPAFPKGDTV